MAIHFKTSTPKKLLRTYKSLVDEGRILTWSYDSEGDFTHTADQWIKKAWLRPQVKEGEVLTFYILAPRDTSLASSVYAVYHGRFIESVLRHCDNLFRDASASAMPEDGDVV